MSDIYVMQRANGDVFAHDDHGRFRVPLFRRSGEAMIARSYNVEMMLFKPIPLDASLLSELATERGGTDVDLCLVDDPLLSLKRGRLVKHAELGLLMRKENGPEVPVPGVFSQSGGGATETWDDEGGNTQSVHEVARTMAVMH